MEYSLAVAVLLGLLSGLHCLSMCGGIIGTLSASLPAQVRASRGQLLAYSATYSLGRIASYAVAGALAGGLSGTVVEVLAPAHGPGVLRVLAALMVVAMGLHFAGWWPRLAAIERFGGPVWRRLEPLGRRLLPVRSLPQALLFGMIWGWLPCSPVYSALVLALATGESWRAATFMLLFGAGTLPTVLTAGLVSGAVMRLRRLAGLRRGIGIALVGLGLAGLWFATVDAPGSGHAGHGTPLSVP